MKKLIAAAAATAALGAGVYAEPAQAGGRYEPGQQYGPEDSSPELNALVDRGNEIIRLTTDKGASANTCALWAERRENLANIRSHGVWLGPNKAFHLNEDRIARHNISACKDRGYLGGRPVPVAQNQSSRRAPNAFAEGMTWKQLGDYQTQNIIKNCGYPNDSKAYEQCKNQAVNLGLGEMLFGW